MNGYDLDDRGYSSDEERSWSLLQHVQTAFGGYRNLLSNNTGGLYPQGYNGLSMKLNTHLHLWVLTHPMHLHGVDLRHKQYVCLNPVKTNTLL